MTDATFTSTKFNEPIVLAKYEWGVLTICEWINGSIKGTRDSAGHDELWL